MAANHHATLVVAGDQGVLIRGPSGCGKSSLAWALIEACRQRECFARLVADDQVYVRQSHGRLIGMVPQPLAGLIEVPPLGPRPVAFEAQARLDCVIDLLPAPEIARMIEAGSVRIEGIALPVFQLPQRSTQNSLPPLLKILSDRFSPGYLPT